MVGFKIVCLVLLLVLQPICAIICYSCYGLGGDPCYPDRQHQCLPYENACLKVHAKDPDMGDFMERRCGTEKTCDYYTSKHEVHICAICKTDLCNGSNRLKDDHLLGSLSVYAIISLIIKLLN